MRSMRRHQSRPFLPIHHLLLPLRPLLRLRPLEHIQHSTHIRLHPLHAILPQA